MAGARYQESFRESSKMKLLVWAPGSAIVITSSNRRHKYWVDGSTAEEARPWEWNSNKAGRTGSTYHAEGYGLSSKNHWHLRPGGARAHPWLSHRGLRTLGGSGRPPDTEAMDQTGLLPAIQVSSAHWCSKHIVVCSAANSLRRSTFYLGLTRNCLELGAGTAGKCTCCS